MASLISDCNLESAIHDWDELSTEYKALEFLHQQYKSKLNEYFELSKKCLSGVRHQRYRMSAIENMLEHASVTSDLDKSTKASLEKDMTTRRAQLSQMSDNYPQQSGNYLKIILGSINVSILDTQAKYDYKDDYEKFKLYINVIAFMLAILALYFDNRVLDLVFLFLTVWYYCTLTIRESILIVNGSKIKGWWRAHHFIATVTGGLILIWPDGDCFREFRNQLMWFSVYLSFIQYLQFFYQRGCLYRLRSMGERASDMDITINGFHSWMWKGLGFLLPFLYIGYLFQIYNAYTLYHLSFRGDATWQVYILCVIFSLFGVGNMLTTSFVVIPSKIGERQKGILRLRFIRLDKYFWSKDSSVESSAASSIRKSVRKVPPLNSMSSTIDYIALLSRREQQQVSDATTEKSTSSGDYQSNDKQD